MYLLPISINFSVASSQIILQPCKQDTIHNIGSKLNMHNIITSIWNPLTQQNERSIFGKWKPNPCNVDKRWKKWKLAGNTVAHPTCPKGSFWFVLVCNNSSKKTHFHSTFLYQVDSLKKFSFLLCSTITPVRNVRLTGILTYLFCRSGISFYKFIFHDLYGSLGEDYPMKSCWGYRFQ